MKMRKILAVLSVLAMLCTVLPMGALVSAASVVASYDFEDGTSSWGGTVIEGNGGYAIQWDANGYGYLNKKPTMQDNTWYKVTFDHKGDPVNALIWNDSVALAVAQTPTSADWTTYTYIFYSGVHATRHFRFQNPSSSAKTICLDNIKLETLDGTAQYDNYLYDGNFEADAGNWVKLQSGIGVTADPTGAGQGNVLKTDSTAQGDMFRQRFYLDAQTDYVLSFKVYGYATSITNSVFYVKFNSKLTYDLAGIVHDGLAGTAQASAYSARCNVNTNTGKWINVSIPFSSNDATATDITIYNYRTTGQFYFDDFKVVKAGEEPEPEPEPEEPEIPVTGTSTFDGYLYNGNFENGTDKWTVSGGEIAVIDGDIALKGTTVDGTQNQRYNAIAEQIITVEPNTNYILSLNTKYVGTNTGAMARVHVYKGATSTTEALDSSNTYYWNIGANTWEGKQLLFNAGDDTQVRILIQQHCAPNTSTAVNGNVYFDDFVVTEKQEEASYVGSYPETMTSGADIRFMTYNVLVGQDTNKGGYSWGQPIGTRPEKACAMINYYKPDVIALEEFSGEWYEYFQANMTDYAFGIMESKDSQNNGILYTCLAYNVNTIRLLDTDLFRNTVSRWGTQGMRYVNVGFFEVIATGEKFIGAVTHPDAGNLVGTSDLNGDGIAEEGDGYWRPQMLEEAAAYVKGLSDTHKMPVVWGGDFNSGLDGTYDDNISWYKVADAGFTDATNGRYIDHIFYNGMATHLYETTVADAAVSGASDHKAVFADIQFLDEFATPIKDVKDNIKTQGRTTLKDGALWLDYSASGIEFKANCEGTVALNLNVKSIKNTDATYGGIYFTVIVDGVTKNRAECRITETGSVQLVLAENLSAGNHTFEVDRQTEQRGAEVGITSIVMNGTIGNKIADNNLYIEFIGDSISTGYGALGDVSNDDHNTNANSPLFQDATVAYPYLTAKALNADFSDVCNSGIGAKYGYEGFTMQQFYPLQRYHYDKTTQYNFNARQPDVVVIALGTNDIHKGPEGDTAARKAGYQELLDLVRAKNPNSKIVWIYGMMDDTDNAMIAALMEENGGGAAGLYSCELTTNGSGAGWHPSKEGQAKFAEELVAFLNDEVLVNYIPETGHMTDGQDGLDKLYSGENHAQTSRMEMDDGTTNLGLAFRFTLNADNAGILPGKITQVDLSNATVDIFGDGTDYKLVRMGAVVANDPSYGAENMTLDNVDDIRCININATYIFDLEPDSLQFAVRITNVPVGHEMTMIYARAYYVFEYEGREVIVYDDCQSANYANKYESNDGGLDWSDWL